MLGLALGLARMGLEFAYPSPRCGVPDERPSLVKDVHYLHFAILLCALTAVAVVGISLLSGPPAESQGKDTARTLPPRSPDAEGHMAGSKSPKPRPMGKRTDKEPHLVDHFPGVPASRDLHGQRVSRDPLTQERNGGLSPSVTDSQEGAPGTCPGMDFFRSPQGAKAEGPPAKALRDATEAPFWARICCINAVILMCVNVFCYAYFA
ncbi:Sodium/glucose cotransporter 4 [Chelonia mydas]|uniref:Sodium/glucose cotransporter 4 n=1 Tax=Chelonia mydas TaxID=8469 RepID=M7C4V6_CHEMY|nr:Sodium/glucose cotransporter 4 [Chelonia mydas]